MGECPRVSLRKGLSVCRYAQMPNDLNISSEDEYFSTRPACLSSKIFLAYEYSDLHLFINNHSSPAPPGEGCFIFHKKRWRNALKSLDYKAFTLLSPCNAKNALFSPYPCIICKTFLNLHSNHARF